MSYSRSSRPAYLRVVVPEPTPASDWPPLPIMVPLLGPDQVITSTQEVLFTMLAQRARKGDQAANQLLWRAFEARLEPVVRSCARATRQSTWPSRDGQPWVLDDLRQEAFLVFSDLTLNWDDTGSYIPYVTTHFAWRLRMAARRLEPHRQVTPHVDMPDLPTLCREMLDVEYLALLDAIAVRLSPADVMVLELRVREGRALSDIASQLGVPRRTIIRRWEHICTVVNEVLNQPGATA